MVSEYMNVLTEGAIKEVCGFEVTLFADIKL